MLHQRYLMVGEMAGIPMADCEDGQYSIHGVAAAAGPPLAYKHGGHPPAPTQGHSKHAALTHPFSASHTEELPRSLLGGFNGGFSSQAGLTKTRKSSGSLYPGQSGQIPYSKSVQIFTHWMD